MAAQPQPTRTYDFTGGSNAVADQVDADLNTLYTVLQGGVGDTHIASDAAISWSKMASTAWTTYTPGLTNVTIGNGTINGAYMVHGKTVHLTARLVLGSTSSVSGTVGINLPSGHTTLNGSVYYMGVGRITDSGTSHYVTTAELQANDSVVGFYVVDSSVVNASTPMTWANGDSLSFSITYELA